MEKQPRPHPGYNKSRTARLDHCDVLRAPLAKNRGS